MLVWVFWWEHETVKASCGPQWGADKVSWSSPVSTQYFSKTVGRWCTVLNKGIFLFIVTKIHMKALSGLCSPQAQRCNEQSMYPSQLLQRKRGVCDTWTEMWVNIYRYFIKQNERKQIFSVSIVCICRFLWKLKNCPANRLIGSMRYVKRTLVKQRLLVSASSKE